MTTPARLFMPIKKLVLFDAHAILHRAYHAMPDFATSKGQPSGGLYGLATMLMKIINELKPDYLAACYDRPEETFRKQVYKEYKGTRAKTDDELVAQMERSREIFAAFHIPVYDQPSFEADDIIGTIVEQIKNNPPAGGVQIIIASGDMDTLQLVSGDQVIVYTLKKGINDTITYNEKGVKERFGFKPALLPDYKGLRGDPSDNIIGVPGIGDKTASELVQKFGSIEQIYKKLNKSEKDFKAAGIKTRIIGLLKEYEEEALFSKTLATIRRDAPIKYELPTQVWRETYTPAAAEKIFTELEFKSLITRAKNLVAGNLEAGLPSGSPASFKEASEANEAVVPELAIAAWLLDSSLNNATSEDVERLGGRDKILTRIKTENLTKVYQEIELPLIPIIAAAEERGILINIPYLQSLAKEYRDQADALVKKVYKLAGREFNLNSPKQLAEVLFDELKLSVKGLKKTKGGARSTRESELLKLAEQHEVVKFILAYRELQKLLSTYIEAIPKLVGQQHRLHTHLHQTGTTTGRMSSTNPNLQNIPAREGLGLKIREAFMATPGYEFIAADYSQIELRVLAILAKEEALIKIFKDGKDVHAAVASLVFKVPAGEVTKDMRRQAKVINFGIIYGMGVNALKINLGSTREEAQTFYDNYFATFPHIQKYFDKVIAEATRKGYTETYFGRRRYFPELKSKLPFMRAAAERMAMNAPLQGTAADLVKLAMSRADTALREKNLLDRAHFILQIHDELIYEVEESMVKRVEPIIKQAMESVLDEVVPIVANTSTGTTWAELK
ncbi:MAG: DNA polymerase [bacterium]|nr:DNA polymerase [bacterium]